MRRFHISGTLLIIVLLFIGWKNPVPGLKIGIWRAILERPDGEQIVFNFETKSEKNRKVLYVLNGEERLQVDSVRIVDDSVFIQMPFFESSFRAKIQDNGSLRGIWIKRLANRDQVMPFRAEHNKEQRFPVHNNADFNISGRWSVNFFRANNTFSKAVGEFFQVGNKLTGTFLTSSGDYRYLQGVVTGDSLFLSGFDGGFAQLFKAKIEGKDSISGGRFFSGPTSITNWSASRDSTASLPDEYSQTNLKEGETKLNFSFPDLNGKSVSIKDEKFSNKVVVVQILGSWCPNCMDETNFLSEFYNRNHSRGIEMIGLAYERTTDEARSLASLRKYQQRFKVKYPILLTGVAVSDPLRTEKTLPQLDKIKVFPTSIIINKKGEVVKIHSGFSGPGTGDHYQKYKKEFGLMIDRLLRE